MSEAANHAQAFAKGQEGTLPGELGITWDHVGVGAATGRMTVARKHMAPNGFLHAASVIALVDSACGYGCMSSLPPGATGFTTLELKANYLASAQAGDVVVGNARLLHGGRMTQVWDAEAVNETTGKTMALFRCTQMILHPR